MVEIEPQAGPRPDAHEIVSQVFNEYAPEVHATLWPWETARWFELVFCMLVTIGEPNVTAASLRELTGVLSRLGLLDVPLLARAHVEGKEQSLFVTLTTLLRAAGFTPQQAASATRSLAEAACVIDSRYGAKIQYLLRKHGEEMLARITEDLGLRDREGCSRALSLWLQNVLNMPIPASNVMTDEACKSLGVSYEALVEAAYRDDMNVALLDDALCNYAKAERLHGGGAQATTRP